MKILLSALVLAALAVPAGALRSPVGPVVRELAAKRIECTAISAVSYRDGQVRSNLDPEKPLVKTCNQYGGQEYDDAMCFIVRTRTPQGKESAMGFGCIELIDDTVAHSDERSLRLYRRAYDETIEMDFTTGAGRISYHYRSVTWGRVTTFSGSAELTGCRILAEPARDCAQARNGE